MIRKRTLLRIGLVLAVMSLVVWLLKPSPVPVLELPSDDEIVEMRASIPTIPQFPSSEPVPEFVVPPDHVAKIMFWLRPSEYGGQYVRNFTRAVEHGIYFQVGEVMIRTKAGEELRLRCYDWGVNPVAFTANGKDYFLGHVGDEEGKVYDSGGTDGGARLHNVIKNAHEARGK